MKYLIVISAFILAVSACTNDSADDLGKNCDVDTVSFANDIQPIFNNSCAFSGCHKGSNPASGIELSNHSGASAVNNNLMLAAIKHEAGASPMPKSAPKLDDCPIGKIEAWIQDGKPNN